MFKTRTTSSSVAAERQSETLAFDADVLGWMAGVRRLDGDDGIELEVKDRATDEL